MVSDGLEHYQRTPFQRESGGGHSRVSGRNPEETLETLQFCWRDSAGPFRGVWNHTKSCEGAWPEQLGFEVDLELRDTIRRKLETTNGNGKITFQQRKDARKLRSLIRESVKRRKSVALTHMA